jgi:hypothetical protein
VSAEARQGLGTAGTSSAQSARVARELDDIVAAAPLVTAVGEVQSSVGHDGTGISSSTLMVLRDIGDGVSLEDGPSLKR